MRSALEAYRDLGWVAIPVHGIRSSGACTCSRGQECTATGKHPVLPSWSKEFLTHEQLRDFFADPTPYNVGIVTGPPSGIFVVDVDARSGGLDSLARLAEQGCPLPCSVLSRTGGGGFHIIYQLPEGAAIRSSAGSLGPGLDIRASGGMIVAPPSLHKSGAPYEWDEGMEAGAVPDPPPEWLLDRLRSATAPRQDLVIEPGKKLGEGQRHPPFLRFAGMLHRYGVTEEGVYRTLVQLDQEMCDPIMGPEEIRRIARSSAKWEPQNESEFIDQRNYLQLARDYVQARYSHLDGRTLHYWQGQWLAWDATTYRQTSAEEIRADAVKLHAMMKVRKVTAKETIEERFRPDIKHGNEFMRALETTCMLPADIPWPSWAGTQEAEQPASQILPCTNGLLSIQTRELLRHTPAFLCRHRIDIAFDAGAAEPREWLAFLAQLWPDDQESIDTLQQIFGYILAGGLEMQSMFLILGPPRSGKGTIGIVLEHLVGRHNSVSPTLSCLASSFGLEPLIDKRLALISDCRLGKRANQSAIVEKLLPYSAGDTQLVNRKHQSMQTVRPTARFVFLTNEMPGFFDASGALASRFLLLKLTESFLGREDRGLQKRLLEELPGILLWSLAGLDSLRAHGRFVQPASAADITDDLLEMTSQVGDFVAQQCLVGRGYTVARKELWERYNRWLATEQGWHTQVTFSKFKGDLRSAVPRLENIRPAADESGRRPRAWRGIGLRPPAVGESRGMLP